MAGEDLLRIGARLKLDAAAAEVIGRLKESDVPVVLLKGSALAERLYAPSEPRFHEDIDLLVPPHEISRVGEVLVRCGFAYAADEEYAQDWIRARDGVTVDVHTTFLGVGVEPQVVWQELTSHTRRATIGAAEVPVFDDAALGVHVALHAAQHGPRGGKALEDLTRATQQLDSTAWQDAASLAERLDAAAAMGAGLRLVPSGRTLADKLGLPEAHSADVALRASSPPVTTLGIERLLTTPGLRGKTRLLAHELMPSRTFMRAAYPVARRGPAGLIVAYAWRPFWLLWHAAPALRARRRVERSVRRPEP